MIKIGIIGGSGLDNPEFFTETKQEQVITPYGSPSSEIRCGKIGTTDVCILSRHGKKHEIPPTQVNYRANISALKQIGCTHILASSAVGSLKEQIKPGDIVFPNQFIDFTKQRKLSFFEDFSSGIKHTPMAEPFSETLRKILIESCEELDFKKHDKASIVVIEGPRFSTKAESFMFRNFADIIGMTTVPECSLAKEAGLEYASIAMSTDYDCWKDDEEPVTWESLLEIFKANVEKVTDLLVNVIPKVK